MLRDLVIAYGNSQYNYGTDFSSANPATHSRHRTATKQAEEALLTAIATLEANQLPKDPDYCWDYSDSDSGVEWSDRNILADDLCAGDYMRITTAYNGPDRWFARIPTEVDEDGTTVDDEVQEFNTEDEAKAAIAAISSTPPGTDGREG